ncbi:hypothetical protein, partial [Agromyces seonyuensis]
MAITLRRRTAPVTVSRVDGAEPRRRRSLDRIVGIAVVAALVVGVGAAVAVWRAGEADAARLADVQELRGTTLRSQAEAWLAAWEPLAAAGGADADGAASRTEEHTT